MAKKKPGKYDGVLDGLPKMAMEDDPRRQDRINAIKAEAFNGLRATELAQHYAALRRRKLEAAAALSAVQLKLDAVTQMLVESQEMQSDEAWGLYGAGDNAIKLPNGDGIRINKEPAAKVVDEEAFRLWCINNGYARQMHLHPGRRETLAAERLLAGEPEPDGLEVYSWTKITFTQGEG